MASKNLQNQKIQEKKFFSRSNASALILLGVIFFALFFSLVLPGATCDLGERWVEETKALLFGFFVGYVPLSTKGIDYMYGDSYVLKGAYVGGISTAGLISLCLIVLGLIFAILSLITKRKIFNLISSTFIVFAGIAIFFLLSAGTRVTVEIVDGQKEVLRKAVLFVKMFEDFSLGAGTYLYGITAILGGGFGIFNHFKKLI